MRDSIERIDVLHVDDEPGLADMVADFLASEDDRIHVRTATSAREGLERLADSAIDCIVSDYEMPGQDGIQFLETVREDYPELPFILYTGKGSEVVASEAISAGVTDYLQKEEGTDQYELLAAEIVSAVEKYRTEKELDELRRQYTKLVEQNLVGIYIIQDGEFIYVNPRLAEIHGYDHPDEIIGMSPLELVAPGERDTVQRNLDRRMAGEVEEVNYRTIGLQRDGERIPIELHGSRIEYRGAPAVIGAELDISERRERELELEQEQEFIDQALNALDDIFYVVGEDGQLRRWNDKLSEVTGYSDEEIAEMNVLEFFPEDETKRITDAIDETLTSGRSIVELEVLTADGTRIPFEFSGSRLVDTDGEVMGFIGIARDLTDRKTREQAVTALHEVAKELTELESVEEICERTIDAAENLLDFDLSVIAIEEDGFLYPTAVSSEMDPGDYEPMSIHEGIAGKTYRMEESYLIDDAVAHDDAEPKEAWRSVISLPLHGHGNFQAVDESKGAFDERDLQLAELLISHTTNHLNRLEARGELERKNERLNEFAAIASHDLRNPLNVATGRLELAREECDNEHLAHVEDSLQRMERLIEDLLSLARQGDAIDEPEPVSLESLVEKCWTTVDMGNARLDNQAEGTLAADPDRLCQLVENLFRNAIEHAGEDVTVTVGTLDDGFFVEDDGPGIDPSERNKVFESGYSTKVEGTGFGLSIVREIVDSHDWAIRVRESRAGGARFEITGIEFVAD